MPTNTYSIERVAPIEDIVNYRDRQGNEYVAVSADFEQEAWINNLIGQYGLEQLCEMFPYQPLRVDKATGLLVPIFHCEYQAKATNLFHIIYHMKLDAAQDQPQPQQNEYQNMDTSSPPQTYGFEQQFEESPSQVPEYSPHWQEAFHINEGEPNYVDHSLTELVEDPNNPEYKYGITNDGGDFEIDDTPPSQPYHPNPAPQYNPWYGYGYPLPGYNQPFFSDETFHLLQEESKKAMQRDEANMRYATEINNQVKQQNPTLLDTSSDTVDFANPESVSKFQGGMYANPYYNNLNNPNIQQQGIRHNTNNATRTIVNPFYQRQRQQQTQRQGYVTRNQQPWFSWKYNSIPFTEEEKRRGKGISLKVVKQSQLKKKEYKEPPKEEEKKFSVKIVKMYEVKQGDEIVKMTKEEYQRYLDENGGKEVPQDSGRYRFSNSIIRHVLTLANKMAVYDKIMKDCLIDCMDDKNYNIDDFLLFVKLVGEKYERIKKAEAQHPERNYRVPYRYKRLPIKIKDPETGKIGFTKKEDYQEMKSVKAEDGTMVQSYAYDRQREINQEEYNTFYEQILYERDVEIQLYRFKVMADEAQEEMDLSTCDWTNPMEVRLHETRMIEKKKKDQYSIYKAAFKMRMTDEEFDNWWYQNDISRRKPVPKTEDDLIFEVEQRRRALGEQRQIMLADLGPVDYNRRAQMVLENARRAARDFDEGYMDGCTSLKDFFDRLGYLDMKCHEYTIKEQREEFRQKFSVANRTGWRDTLEHHELLKVTYDPEEAISPYQKPTLQDFIASEEYKTARDTFFNYCDHSMGVHYELKPLFKAGPDS